MHGLPLPLFLAGIGVRTLIVLAVVLVLLRVLGKRELGMLNIFDVAVVLLLANAIQNAITSGSGYVWVGIVSALTLLLADRALATFLVRHHGVERRIEGDPVLLCSHGRLDAAACRRSGVTREQILAVARDHGLAGLEDIAMAVRERDGSISIIEEEDGGQKTADAA